ncbi:MAG: hypothetical protein IKF90_08870 [Parasporobacterium sp.]|nr:hypothetical protein [Parasporobacterium sp.]
MPIIFIPENNEYNPLELEPYRSFNRKFEDREDEIDGAQIKLSISNQRRGYVDGFSVDRYYCDDITLKFMFSHIREKRDGNDILIHHLIEYGFATTFVEIQQDMAEEFKVRSEHIYIPGVMNLELSYRLTSKNIQLIFDVVTAKDKVQTVCNQLISHDIAMFSRGW